MAQFLEIKPWYDNLSKEFPGFEETVGFQIAPELLDQVRKKPEKQPLPATAGTADSTKTTGNSGAKG